MEPTGGRPPKRRRKPVWTLMRRGTIALGFIAAVAQATYWLLQLHHAL
ncbi:hypothetical protein P3T27_007983 [Kitasatospora sp. MAA19]|nr:hypothetical protein [Kitasatospora sp. MAA19]MDH6711230.1 hypothetical protein [Kitasatospora sp. MAA19]